MPPHMRSPSHPTPRPPKSDWRAVNGTERHTVPPASVHRFPPNVGDVSLSTPSRHQPRLEIVPVPENSLHRSIPPIVPNTPAFPQAPPIFDPMRRVLFHSFQEKAAVLREAAAYDAASLLSPHAPLLNANPRAGRATSGNIPLTSSLLRPSGPSNSHTLISLATKARAAELAAVGAARDYEFAARRMHLDIASAGKILPDPYQSAAFGRNCPADLEAAEACLALGQKNQRPKEPPKKGFLEDTKKEKVEFAVQMSEQPKKRKRSDSENNEEPLDNFPKRPTVDRKKAKRPADAPRRPLSAYNFFFSEEREKILKSLPPPKGETGSSEELSFNPISKQADSSDPAVVYEAIISQRLAHPKTRRRHRKTHGKIGFKDLAKLIGERWRNLPTERVAFYKQLAELDLSRYKIAMEDYGRKNLGKSKTEDDDNACDFLP